MKPVWSIRLVTWLGLLAMVAWLCSAPGWEPLASVILALAGYLGFEFSSRPAPQEVESAGQPSGPVFDATKHGDPVPAFEKQAGQNQGPDEQDRGTRDPRNDVGEKFAHGRNGEALDNPCGFTRAGAEAIPTERIVPPFDKRPPEEIPWKRKP